MKSRFCLSVLLVILLSGLRAQNDSLLRVFRSSPDPTARIGAAKELAKDLMDDHPDSALIILDQAAEWATEDSLTMEFVDICSLQSNICLDLEDYAAGLEFMQQARNRLEDSPNVPRDSSYYYKLAKILQNEGLVMIRSNLFNEALNYYDQATRLLDSVGVGILGDSYTEAMVTINLNRAAIYIYTKDFESAGLYLTKALNAFTGNDNTVYAHILNNMAIVAKETGDIPRAIDYNQQALALREKDDDVAGIAQSLNNLGSCYFLLDDKEKAINLFNRSLEISRENNLSNSAIIALTYLSDLLYNTGQYKEAYEMHSDLKNLNDSITDIRRFKLIAQMEARDRYDRKIRDMESIQEKQTAERKRRELIFLLVISLSALALVIVILLYFLQRNKMKRTRLENEKNLLTQRSLELEKENLEKTLEFRDKELATNVMYMARTNEFITNISEKLLRNMLSFSKESQVIIHQIIHDLQSYVDQDSWQEFEIRFQQVHNEFYTKLNELFPNLTPNERKLCAFLRLNMTTKEISAITYQSVNSIMVARSRLRKKLNLDSDENLIAFLEGL